MNQKFKIELELESNIARGVNEEKFLDSDHVKNQLEKWLKYQNVADGLPCHGDSKFRVLNVKEI